ncbi:hypothetical protein AVEN_93147-1 [Araneus ventricosus]|uniref:Uncharacterized protein n=1 Tax=Araneus ventricosus TaxID=182803 RepID=A0A4Y2MR72_ARAVE|nr:hypothetical protein AVEN_229486-1 [Araneus ventricosus]GBN29651.1 hypothetical protein AVEN_93147-1 [Araneus ventricosus]
MQEFRAYLFSGFIQFVAVFKCNQRKRLFFFPSIFLPFLLRYVNLFLCPTAVSGKSSAGEFAFETGDVCIALTSGEKFRSERGKKISGREKKIWNVVPVNILVVR